MHGFALNVDPDLAWFDNIVPCGISEFRVTSVAAEGVAATMRDVVDAVAARAAQVWGDEPNLDRADVAWAHRPEDLSVFSRAHSEGRALGRLVAAGVDTSTAVTISARKPEWLRAKADFGPEYRALKKTMRSLELVTVCEEAGCPNISECWSDGTATFMINGERCTRACGFCLVDTRKPAPQSPDEPERVAAAVAKLGLRHTVVTTVARDDLDDGGAGAFAETIAAIRARSAGTAVEVLISDCKGDASSLDLIYRGPARRPQSQPGDGGSPAAGGAPIGRLRPQPRRARPGEGRGAHDQIRPHGRPRRGPRRSARRAARPAWCRASTS